MKQNIVLAGAVLAAALGGAALSYDPVDDRIRHLEERIDRLERRSTRLGFEHDRRADYGRTDCGTNEVATGVNWQDKTLRCAELTSRDY
jgi:hypothetical protein